MRRGLVAVITVVALGGIVGLAQQSTPKLTAKSPIEGVWRAVEQTINGRTLKGTSLGVGFQIYTRDHFAVVRETGEAPRPYLSGDLSTASKDQLISTWGPFVAQFGTYEISGDRIIETLMVAKNPLSQDYKPTSRRFRLEGDTLITEPVDLMPGERAITLTMVRVE